MVPGISTVCPTFLYLSGTAGCGSKQYYLALTFVQLEAEYSRRKSVAIAIEAQLGIFGQVDMIHQMRLRQIFPLFGHYLQPNVFGRPEFHPRSRFQHQ